MKPHAYNTIPIPAVHVMDLVEEGKMKEEQVDDLRRRIDGKYSGSPEKRMRLCSIPSAECL